MAAPAVSVVGRLRKNGGTVGSAVIVRVRVVTGGCLPGLILGRRRLMIMAVRRGKFEALSRSDKRKRA